MRGKGLFHLSLGQRERMYGYLFTLPLILGFVFFFLHPLIESVRFSLSRLIIDRSGFYLEFIGLENYRQALLVDAQYTRLLVESVVGMLRDVPLIITFSMFAALLLNQRFRGTFVARVIFFLPVIYAAGIIVRMESSDYMLMIHSGGAEVTDGVRIGAAVTDFLVRMRLPEGLLLYILQALSRVSDIIRSSGVQTLVFLAGLQSVSPELYEASDLEGAGKWEEFWLITFPLMSPLILTNAVYTVVDSFTSGRNQLMVMLKDAAFGSSGGYGLSTAMAWMYFCVVAIVLAVTIGVISRKVFYRE